MPVIVKDNKYYMSDGVGIFYGRNSAEKVHTHEFVEIVYTRKGKCTHIIDGEEYLVRHGDMVIINYNQTHEFMGDSETEYINILIKPEFINKSLGIQENAFALLNLTEFSDFYKILDRNKCKVSFSRDEREWVENIISVMYEEMENRKEGYELMVRSQLNSLLISVFRKMSLSMENAFTGVGDELLNYIVRNCHEKLTLEDIAKKCSYNTAYFSRKFKDFAGMTFTEFLKKARIEKAMALLRSTELKISHISEQVGYSDKTKFFTHFSAVTGMTPLQYRKSKK